MGGEGGRSAGSRAVHTPSNTGVVIFNRHTAEFSAKLFQNIVSLCQSIHSTDRSHLRHEEVDKLGLVALSTVTTIPSPRANVKNLNKVFRADPVTFDYKSLEVAVVSQLCELADTLRSVKYKKY
jgi:hypothetical protein